MDEEHRVEEIVAKMIQMSKDNGLPSKHHCKLETIVSNNISVFYTQLSAGHQLIFPL